MPVYVCEREMVRGEVREREREGESVRGRGRKRKRGSPGRGRNEGGCIGREGEGTGRESDV